MIWPFNFSKEAARYKAMFEDAVSQHNAQMARAEKAESERDQACQALQPFARFSSLHPNARRDADAGAAGLHDPRCPITIADYHHAAEILNEIEERRRPIMRGDA